MGLIVPFYETDAKTLLAATDFLTTGVTDPLTTGAIALADPAAGDSSYMTWNGVIITFKVVVATLARNLAVKVFGSYDGTQFDTKGVVVASFAGGPTDWDTKLPNPGTADTFAVGTHWQSMNLLTQDVGPYIKLNLGQGDGTGTITVTVFYRRWRLKDVSS